LRINPLQLVEDASDRLQQNLRLVELDIVAGIAHRLMAPAERQSGCLFVEPQALLGAEQGHRVSG
jgi:hypothetical protein